MRDNSCSLLCTLLCYGNGNAPEPGATRIRMCCDLENARMELAHGENAHTCSRGGDA